MIQQINSLAETRIPFLLIVDFEMQNPLIFPMDELPHDIRFTTPVYRSPEDSPVSFHGQVEFQSEPVEFSRYAEDVRVEKFRYIDTLGTNWKKLLQVSSVISGCLPDKYHYKLGEIIFPMLPAGSVSGAPK